MTSTLQVKANRRNAKRSTGPRTKKGKLASSTNAVKHGLRSKQLVVMGEKFEELDSIREDLFADFSPTTTIEEILIENLAILFWRLQRAWIAEAGILKKEYWREQEELAIKESKKYERDIYEIDLQPEITDKEAYTRANVKTNYAREMQLAGDLGLSRSYQTSLPTLEAIRRYERSFERSISHILRELRGLKAKKGS